jgi:rhodanese-related sulfurtransferase
VSVGLLIAIWIVMAIHMKTNNPSEAKEYFEKKMSFSTGPVEVDYFKQQGESFNLIDVRAAEDYAKGHVPGAVNLPQDQWNSFQGLSKDKLNVLYCYSHVCHLAAKAAVKFAKEGFPVMEMDGGFEAWQDHDLDVESSSDAAKAARDQVA